MSAPPPDNRNWIDRYLDNLKSLAEDNPDDYTTVAGVPVGIHPRKLLDPPGLVGSALGLASKAVGDPLATPVTAPLGALMRAANQLPRAPWMTDEQERERAPFSDQPLIPFAGNNLDPAAYAEYAKANLEQSVPGQVALGMATPLSLLGGGFKGVGTALAKAGSPALAKAAGPLIRMDEAYTGSMDEIARLGGQFVKGPARDFGKKVPVYGKAQEWALKDSPDKIASQYMARMRDAFKSAGDAIRNDGGTGVADLARPGAAVVTNLPKGPKAFNVVGATYKTINERILGMHPEHQVAALRVFGDAIDATNAIQTRSAIERAHLFDEWGKVKGSLAGQDLIDAKAEMDMAKRLSFDAQAQSQYKDQLAVLHAFEEIEKTPITNWLDPGAATTVRAATKEAVETAHTAATEAKRYARQLRGGTEIDPTTGLSITRAPIWERPTWYDNMNALLGEDPAYREARERGLAAIRGAGLASGIDETDDLTMMARSVYAKRRQGLEGWDKPAMERMGNLKLTPQFTTVMGEALDHPKQYFNRAAKEVTAARASLTRRTEAAIVAYARSQGATQADIDAKLPALMASAKTALSNPAFIASKSVLGGTKRTDLGMSLSKLAARYDQYGDLFDPGQVDGIIAGRVGELFKREDLGIRPMRRGIVVPGIGMTAVDELQKIPGLNTAAQGLDKAWKQETIGKLNDYFIDQGMSVKDAGAEAARLAASPRDLLAHPITRELLKDDLRTGAGIALGSWKEQNLLAPAYHVANVTSQAVLGTLAHAYGGDDVDPRLWMNLLRRKMNQLVKEGKVDNSFPAEISRKLAKIGGDGTEARAWDGLADTVGEPANIPGAETESATGRIPLPIRLALWGGGTAAAGYETAELAGLSPEDRAKLTGVGGLLGALYGWKVPALTKANFLLASATEKPARMAAGIATYEDEMGHVDWDAVKNAVTGRGRSLTFARDDIARLAAVTEVQTPGRRVMGPIPRGDPSAPLPGPEPLPIAPEPQPDLAVQPETVTPPPPDVVAPSAEPTVVEPAPAPAAAAAAPEARPRRVSSLPDFPDDGALPEGIPQTAEGLIDFGQPGIVMRDPRTGQTLETVGQTRRNSITGQPEALMRTGEQGPVPDEQWRGTTDLQALTEDLGERLAWEIEVTPPPSRAGQATLPEPPAAAAPLTTPTGGFIPEGAEWMADWTQEQADQALRDSTAFLRTHRQPTPVPEEIVPEGAPDDLAEYAELAGEVTPPVAGPAAPTAAGSLPQAPYEERLGRLFDLAVDRANSASQRTADSLQAPADILRENMADDGLLVPEWFDNPRFAEEVEKAVGALDPTNRQYEAVKQQAIQHVMKDFTPYSDDVTTGLAHPDAVMYRLVRSVDFESADDFADKLLEAADDMNLTLDPHLPESFDRDVQMLGTLKQIADQPLTWVEPPPGAQPAMNELLAMSPDEVNTVLPFLSPADQQRAATLWSAFDETGGRISRGLKQAIVKAQADRGLRVPGGGGGGSGLPPMGPPPAEWTWSAPDPNFQIGPLYRSQEVKQARGLAQGDMPNAPAGIDLEDFFSLGAAGPRIKVGARFNEAAFQRAFAEAHGEMNKDELYELARAHGATRQQATSLRTGWEEHDYQAKQAGTGNANNIHVDYQDINNLLYYAKMGPSPFLTWSAKMIPKYLQIMAHHPAIPIALNEYSKATDQELEDEGLPPSFHNFVQDGGILSRLAQAVMGREGDVYANPLPALFPYSDVGREPSDYASPADVAVDTLRSVGLGPSPLITLPLYLAGLTNDLPINMLRTSPLLSAGVQALTGHAVDPEALPKRAARSIRETLAPASTQDTITGDPIKDYYVRKRIASIAAEKGHQPTGEYLKAIQTGKGPIWDLALRDVEREIGGRTLMSWTAPVRTRLVDTGEQAIREAQVETGITSGALEELNRKPLERKDLQYAAASLARNPLDQGETLEMRAKSLRVSRQFGKARSAEPITGGLSGLGADPRSEARRAQLLEQEGRRTKPLSAKAKASRERTELTRGEQVLRQMGQ